jgi:hypothetical protein
VAQPGSICPRCWARLCARALQYGNDALLEAIVTDPQCPMALLEQLANPSKRTSPHILACIAGRPSRLSPTVLDRLARSVEADIRQVVALREDAPPEVYMPLQWDTITKVAQAAKWRIAQEDARSRGGV